MKIRKPMGVHGIARKTNRKTKRKMKRKKKRKAQKVLQSMRTTREM